MTQDLENKVCLVTGAARGVGRGIAEGFLGRGAMVITTDIDKPDFGDDAYAWDVCDSDRGTEVFQETCEKYGRIDVLVANAGIYPRQEWDEIEPDDWDRIVDTNLKGTWHGVREAGHVMAREGYGKIITVSSITVEMGVHDYAHYCSAKAGIIGLTRSMARALGPRGVRVNCVMLGAVKTEGEEHLYGAGTEVDDLVNKHQAIPGRLLPEDVEPTFAFLASKASDAITGQVITADKGWVTY